jgi:hypothetical protein
MTTDPKPVDGRETETLRPSDFFEALEEMASCPWPEAPAGERIGLAGGGIFLKLVTRKGGGGI